MTACFVAANGSVRSQWLGECGDGKSVEKLAHIAAAISLLRLALLISSAMRVSSYSPLQEFKNLEPTKFRQNISPCEREQNRAS